MEISTATTCRLFGAAVRRARARAKLTQEELAERSDISPRYVQMLEAGRAEPGLVRVRKIAQALGTTGSGLLRRAKL